MFLFEFYFRSVGASHRTRCGGKESLNRKTESAISKMCASLQGLRRECCARRLSHFGKYPPAEPGALGIGPLEAATLNPKLCLTWSAHDIRSPDVTSMLYPIFRHSGEQMPLENCVAT